MGEKICELCSFSDAKRVLAIFMTHPLAERERIVMEAGLSMFWLVSESGHACSSLYFTLFFCSSFLSIS